MLDKTIRTEVKIQPNSLVITLAVPLDFDDLVDLIAYEERQRPAEKCRGLNRNMTNKKIAAALSRGGISALRTARVVVEKPDVVPDHVFDFAERELGFLYPELRDHPFRLQEIEEEEKPGAASEDSDSESPKPE